VGMGDRREGMGVVWGLEGRGMRVEMGIWRVRVGG
jgi:hypothetical protein